MTTTEIIFEFNKNHYRYYGDDCLFVERLRKGGLTDKQIAVVIEAMSDTCRYCMDRDSGCQCWNDE